MYVAFVSKTAQRYFIYFITSLLVILTSARFRISFCESFNLSQLIASPTRVTDSSSSLINVILTSQAKQVIKAGLIDCSISDHDIIFADLRLKKHLDLRSLMSKQEVLKTIILAHFSMTCLSLLGLSWKYSTTSTTNHMHLIFFWMRFLTTMLRSDQLKFEGKPNPCITEETRELMKSRNYWRKRARRTDNPADWSTYKNLKHQVRKLIRAAESEFVKDQIQNNPRNTNCIWKAIRLCLPKRSHQSHPKSI